MTDPWMRLPSADGLRSEWPRRLVVVQGTPPTDSMSQSTLVNPAISGLWIGENAPPHFTPMPIKEAPRLLGTEHALVIVMAIQGIDPDALGIAAGCIPAGGTLVLWLPDPLEEPFTTSPFHQRLLRLLHSFPERISLDAADMEAFPGMKNAVTATSHAWDAACRSVTPDQERAVQAVERVLFGQRKKPALLIADRGRGKSAALGLAAGRILNQRACRILVTGRSRRAAHVVFRHANALTPHAQQNLQWIEIDSLLAHKPHTDLLLVDEAAGISLEHLAILLRGYSRIALATTVHGYEGSGRGFALRFQEILERYSRGWHLVRWETPIRWCLNDPLEARINQLLLLDAELPKLPNNMDRPPTWTSPITGTELAQNEDELRTVFSLLITAHYRTRPRDLRHLLDRKGLLIYRLRTAQSSRKYTIGVLLATQEPVPDPTLRQDIANGQRRPGRHVLAAILAGKFGIQRAVTTHLTRIQRIVIHPKLQRQGLGKRLLQHFCHDQRNVSSLVGTQFALSARLIYFWRSCGFVPVGVGSRTTRFAGTVSGLFLRPLDPVGASILSQATAHFHRQFPASLLRAHRNLNGEIVYAILMHNESFAERPSDRDIREVAGFCFTNRPEEIIPASLSRLVLWGLSLGQLSDEKLCIERVLQAKSWTDCEDLTDHKGRRSGTRRLRQSCTRLLTTQAREVVEDFSLLVQ